MPSEEVEKGAKQAIAQFKRLSRCDPADPLTTRLMLMKMPAIKARDELEDALYEADIAAKSAVERMVLPWSEQQLIQSDRPQAAREGAGKLRRAAAAWPAAWPAAAAARPRARPADAAGAPVRGVRRAGPHRAARRWRDRSTTSSSPSTAASTRTPTPPRPRAMTRVARSRAPPPPS